MCAVMVLVAAVPLALADSHLVTKGAQGPRASAVTWNYEPESLGNWYGHIVNSGLRSLVVDVYDNTTGMPDQMSHERIRFAAYDAYPSGTVDTAMVTMAPGRLYEITVTPNGPRDSTCTVEDMFDTAIPPVAVITVVSQNYLTVAVSGIDSHDDGSIVSYEWNFGDGSAVVMGMDATHTYAKDGTYTITLLVTDDEGLSESATEQVTVQHEMLPPVASFTATMDWMIVSVDASASTDNYGPIASYDWNFGDGLTGTGVTATHIYAVEGPYTITLTVTDSDGQTSMATKDVQAMPEPVNLAPNAVFTATMTYMSVSVDGSASNDPDGAITAYAWNFGDGSTGTGATATHTYATPGVKTITLTVTDNGVPSKTGSVSHDVTATLPPQPPVASFTSVVTFLSVAVDASASSDPDGTVSSYAWTWGDGTTGTGMTATHTYATAGTKTITLTVTDNSGMTGTVSHDVQVSNQPQPPVASFTSVMTYLSVAVDASASSDPDGTISTYAWTWGDGTTGTGKTATHAYATPGIKTITLTVTDNSGLTGTVSHDVTAVNPPQPPVASFTSVVTYLSVAVDASASSDPDGTISTYAWTWGDGTTGTGMTATHTYATAGTKTITLTVTDNSGLTGTVSHDVTAVLPPAPVASFTATVSGLTVNVDGSTSIGTGLTYAWTWGDGTTGTGATATHTYSANAMVIHLLSGKGKAPGPPHPVYGFTYGPDGVTPITDCVMTFTVVRTGEVLLYTEEAGASAYVIDMSMFQNGYVTGDILRITATAPGYSGTTDGTITAADVDSFDVVLQSSGPLPFDVTITLTVTDQFGRTASVSHTYTLTP